MNFRVSPLLGLSLTLVPALIATYPRVIQAQCSWFLCWRTYRGIEYEGGRLPSSEVIAQLENLAKSGQATTDEYLLLAYTHEVQGKYDLAKEHYSTALSLAKSSGDSARQAVALEGLGKVFAATGRQQEAISHLTAAKTLYSRLGNQKLANEINLSLIRISHPRLLNNPSQLQIAPSQLQIQQGR